VSPPCVTLTHLQRRFRNCSADCRRCVGERRCNRGRVTMGGLRPPLSFACVRASQKSRSLASALPNRHGELTPPALVRARSPTDGIATFAMHTRTCTGAAGVSPPCGCQSYGRRDYEHIRKRSSLAAPRAAGVSPPWDRETHSDRRFRNCSADCRPACWRTPLRLRCRVPRGAYAPPALVRARSPAGGIATFPMHKRTSAGAAAGSPPWCGKRTC